MFGATATYPAQSAPRLRLAPNVVAAKATSRALAGGVVVINLDHRSERLGRLAQAARHLGALDGWERLVAVNGLELDGYGRRPWFRQRQRDKCWGARAGCILSHRKAITHARERGWDSVLILEDDVEFGGDFARLADELGGLLHSQARWQACYLGFTHAIGPCRKVADLSAGRGLYEVQGCLTTHAYILKRDTFDWLLARLPDENSVWAWMSGHRSIDRWFSRNLAHKFGLLAVSPGVVAQYSDFSDIAQRDPGTARELEFRNPVDDGGHHTPASFHLQRLLRRCACKGDGVTARLRGLLKRWHGF